VFPLDEGYHRPRIGSSRENPGMKNGMCFLAMLLGLVSSLSGKPLAASETPAEEVAAWLTGTFDSKDQADSDPKGYRAVRIVAVKVPGSLLGAGAPVLYVEQALLATPEKPYRQRFYRIEAEKDGTVVSRVFEPKEPSALSGKWATLEGLAAVGANDVTERSGCAVTLEKRGETWEGGTFGTDCPSSLSGARYAKSRASLTATRMESWDQGFDAAGQQVWGAKEGPYVFRKRSERPPPGP
jgi:hypothetical protein